MEPLTRTIVQSYNCSDFRVNRLTHSETAVDKKTVALVLIVGGMAQSRVYGILELRDGIYRIEIRW